MFILVKLRILIERESVMEGIFMPSATLNFYISDGKYQVYLEKRDVIRAKIKAILLKELKD